MEINWIKAKQYQPNDGMEVIAITENNYYIAEYDNMKSIWVTSDKKERIVDDVIFWMFPPPRPVEHHFNPFFS